MEVVGKIRVITPTKEVGSSGFRKRELVVTTDEQYPQHITVSFVQDKCDLLDKFQVGQDVKVGINLKGREWTNPEGEVKYFNDISGWRVESLQAAAPVAPSSFQQAPGQQMPPASATAAFPPATNFQAEEHDDLPF
jgi:hypothetical protein